MKNFLNFLSVATLVLGFVLYLVGHSTDGQVQLGFFTQACYQVGISILLKLYANEK